MPFIVALLIFVVLTGATWYVSMACYKSTYSGSDPRADPDDATVAACAIGVGTLTCFIPFPVGYFAELVVWAVAVYGFLSLPTGRGTVLLGYLATASVVSRLVVLGVLSAM